MEIMMRVKRFPGVKEGKEGVVTLILCRSAGRTISYISGIGPIYIAFKALQFLLNIVRFCIAIDGIGSRISILLQLSYNSIPIIAISNSINGPAYIHLPQIVRSKDCLVFINVIF